MPFEAKQGREPAPSIPNAYTATTADLNTYTEGSQHLIGMRLDATDFKIKHNQHRYIFVAAFDGTGNDATQTLAERTNVSSLYQDIDNFIHGDGTLEKPGFSRIHARYIEGPGTQGSRVQSNLDTALGSSVEDRAFEMYKDLGDKAREWKLRDKDAQISVITLGFSRGAIEAAVFASTVGKYGIHADMKYEKIGDYAGPNGIELKSLSGELVAPGKVPIAAALFDPVATGTAQRHDRELPHSIRSALQFTAIDEHRVFFPVNKIVTDKLVASDPDNFANIKLAGCHSDIGGGYAEGKGLALRSHNMMAWYLNKVVGHDICEYASLNPAQAVVHDSNSIQQSFLGYTATGYWYADRTQDGPTIQTKDNGDMVQVMSGVDPLLHAKSRLTEAEVERFKSELESNLPQRREERLRSESPEELNRIAESKFKSMSVAEQMEYIQPLTSPSDTAVKNILAVEADSLATIAETMSKTAAHHSLDTVTMHPSGTVDNEFRPKPLAVQPRIHERQNDEHTPVPKKQAYPLDAYGLQFMKEVDPNKLLLESSRHIATLMDRKANPEIAEALHAMANADFLHRYWQTPGESPQGRLSASVAYHAMKNGMDRIDSVTLSEDRESLVVTDRRDDHPEGVKRLTIDLETVRRAPMKHTLRALDDITDSQPASKSMFQQAYDLLDHASKIGYPFENYLRKASLAQEIASCARSDGLARIDALDIHQVGNGRDVHVFSTTQERRYGHDHVESRIIDPDGVLNRVDGLKPHRAQDNIENPETQGAPKVRLA